MAINLAHLEEFLVDMNLRYSIHKDYIRTTYATERFANADGERLLLVVMRLDEEGEYFRLVAPNLYRCRPEHPHAKALYKLLLGVSWKSKLIKYEYDERDGEIRAIIEIPIEDGTLTEAQFQRCLNALIQLIEEYHDAIARTLSGLPAIQSRQALGAPSARAVFRDCDPGRAHSHVRRGELRLEE